MTRSHSHQSSRPHPLPTPPNSISPSLPPHGLRAQLQKAAAAQQQQRLESIDSDLDLQGAPAGTASAGSSRAAMADDGDADHHISGGLGSPTLDAVAGAITPALLASKFLPGILLAHGPLAIRHIMGYLTTSVPGFANIPPAKARRLVVSALESRARGSGNGNGSGTDGGGEGVVDGDAVEFEKVGWGRWDARRRGTSGGAGQASGGGGGGSSGGAADAPSPLYLSAIPISEGGSGGAGGQRLRPPHGSSGESAAFSHDDREMVGARGLMGGEEEEADRMSLDDDGSASASCSEAPDAADVVMGDDDDPANMTDDEDWAAVGAAALRAASYSGHHSAGSPAGFSLPHLATSRVYTGGGVGMRKGIVVGSRSVSATTTGSTSMILKAPRAPRPLNLDFSALGAATSDAQEREAIEALLRLGSV